MRDQSAMADDEVSLRIEASLQEPFLRESQYFNHGQTEWRDFPILLAVAFSDLRSPDLLGRAARCRRGSNFRQGSDERRLRSWAARTYALASGPF